VSSSAESSSASARLVFFGSGGFAVPSLRTLVGAGHQVLAVVAQPDRPKGRGRRPAPPPVAAVARELGLALLQPLQARAPEFVAEVRRLDGDLLVVAAYGQILPTGLLAAAARGAVNLHASLLPRYRGAAPIQWALLQGETTTGVTTMLMEPKLDSGAILLQEAVAIGPAENAAELEQRLAGLGAELLSRTIPLWLQDRLRPQAQDESRVSYAPKLSAALSPIDWRRAALELHNQIRALVPWPVASTRLGSERIRIWRARVMEGSGAPGAVLALTRSGLQVGCGSGTLELLEIQLEGRRRLSAAAAAHGLKLGPGAVFENPGG